MRDAGIAITARESAVAEQRVLGAILRSNEVLTDAVATLRPSSFCDPYHGQIFSIMIDLVRKGFSIDVISVSDRLPGEFWFSYVTDLATNTYGESNINYYLSLMNEHFVLQSIEDALVMARDEVSSDDAVPIKLSKIKEHFTQIAMNDGSDKKTIKQIGRNMCESMELRLDQEDGAVGLQTGLEAVDELLSGMRGGDLAIIAGRPSMGKTAFAMNIAEKILDEGVKVFSLEMPGEQLMERMTSSMGNISFTRMRSGKLEDYEWGRFSETVAKISNSNLDIDDQGRLTIDEIVARARLTVKNQPVSVIIIDHIQLIKIKGRDVNFEIGEITAELKSLAKELDIPIIALSQLNRSLESRPDKRPNMGDLRASGSIEQDADVIMFIYRDEVYNPDTPSKGVAEICIAKNRNGSIGIANVLFVGDNCQFKSFDGGYQPYVQSEPTPKPNSFSRRK